MSSIVEGTKEKKRIKTKIGVGSLVNAEVGDMEYKKREGRSKKTRKEVAGYVHAVAGKKKFLIQFGNGQKKEMISCSLVFLCLKK